MRSRREVIRQGMVVAAGAWSGVRAVPRLHLPLPRVNGGVNVHPIRRLDGVTDFTPPVIVPELVMLQLRAVYELGFASLRTTVSFNEFGPDFLAAIPYVRAARALGVDVLAVIGQFGHGYDLVRALANDGRRSRVLEAYARIFAAPVAPATRRVREPGAIAFQILNEPTEFLGLRPADYVWSVLAPTAADLQQLAPGVPTVAAATVGRRHGVRRLRDMLAAGLELHCDELAMHVYDLELLERLEGLATLPVRVTESGVRGVARHRGWFEDGFDRIRAALPGTAPIYWFDLVDAAPDGFRIHELVETPDGDYSARVESVELDGWLRQRVVDATDPERIYAPFEELIPALDPYLPTADDLAAIENAR